jgi:hypothetical protein
MIKKTSPKALGGAMTEALSAVVFNDGAHDGENGRYGGQKARWTIFMKHQWPVRTIISPSNKD